MSRQQCFAALLQHLPGLNPQFTGTFIELEDSLKIKNQIGKRIQIARHLPQHLFYGAEEKTALKRVDAYCGAPVAQYPFGGRAAPPLGAHGGVAIAAPDDDTGGGAALEHVQLEALGNIFAGADAAPAVALLVERRGEDADAELSGQHGDDATADAALGRQTDAVAPLAGVIVHAATMHDAQHVFYVLLVESAFAGERVDAAIG